MSPHDWSEHTKRVFDVLGAVSAFAAISLSSVALAVSIAAGLMSILWYAIRIYDRLKTGRAGE